MSSEEVTVYVDNLSPPGEAVDNVYVGLHDSSTKALLQTAYTGAGAFASGQVIFSNVDSDLNSGVYELRIVPPYPSIVKSGKVQNITVLSNPVAPKSNIFDIQLTPKSLDVATDTNLCRCSGYFLDSTGRPIKNVSIHFNEDNLRNLDYQVGATSFETRVVIPQTRIGLTDKNGYLTIDLYRGAKYQAYVEGYENLFRIIEIPDAASVNLADVLFPTISSVTYYQDEDPLQPLSAPTIAVGIDETVTLSFKVYLRSGVEAAPSEIEFSSPDISKLEISSSDNLLTLKGISAGSDLKIGIAGTDKDGSIIIKPEPQIIGILSVTVS